MGVESFIGLDLAWSQRNLTGVAVARGTTRRARLVELDCHRGTYDQLASSVAEMATPNTIVAVDAPLVVPNETGRRECEREISCRFGSRHAGAHSSNRGKFRDGGPVEFAEALEEMGFAHGIDAANRFRHTGRRMVEVYPHPALVTLFDLSSIIKYKSKKGRSPEDQRRGLAALRRHLATLEYADPSLDPGECGRELLVTDLDALRGRERKSYEDCLDAWVCVYAALHIARWGSDRNEIFGDLERGYIVVPSKAVAIKSARKPGYSTVPGFVNRNGQIVVVATGRPGTDHLQTVYELECGECGTRYGANGSDIFQRKCPNCQGGRPGIAIRYGTV